MFSTVRYAVTRVLTGHACCGAFMTACQDPISNCLSSLPFFEILKTQAQTHTHTHTHARTHAHTHTHTSTHSRCLWVLPRIRADIRNNFTRHCHQPIESPPPTTSDVTRLHTTCACHVSAFNVSVLVLSMRRSGSDRRKPESPSVPRIVRPSR